MSTFAFYWVSATFFLSFCEDAFGARAGLNTGAGRAFLVELLARSALKRSLGTDFGGHIHKVGPIKARDMIRKYKTIERFLASSEGKKFRSEEVFNYDVPRMMFLDDSFPIEKISGQHENWTPFEILRGRYKEEEEKNPFPKERFHANLTRAELNEQAKRMRQEEEDEEEEEPSADAKVEDVATSPCPPPSAVRKRGRIIRI